MISKRTHLLAVGSLYLLWGPIDDSHFVFVWSAQAQESAKVESKVKPSDSRPNLVAFKPAVELAVLTSKMSYELIFYGKEKAKSADVVSAEIDDFIKRTSPADAKPERMEERELIVKYRDSLKKLFKGLQLVGSQLGEFTYMEGSIPVGFLTKDGETALLVSSIVSESVFNTQKTTAKVRAARIISSTILPALKNFDSAFQTDEIQHFGFCVTYGSKDFAGNTKVLNLKPEVLVFFVAREKCKQFVEGKITEDEVVKTADIYQADRDMVTGFKKISVTL